MACVVMDCSLLRVQAADEYWDSCPWLRISPPSGSCGVIRRSGITPGGVPPFGEPPPTCGAQGSLGSRRRLAIVTSHYPERLPIGSTVGMSQRRCDVAICAGDILYRTAFRSSIEPADEWDLVVY